MRTMVLSTWWALMKRRIGDAMSAAVRERSRASEWVLERERTLSFFSRMSLSEVDGILTDLLYTNTHLLVYLFITFGTYEQIRFFTLSQNRKPTVGRAIFPLEACPACLHWRPRARDPTRARQRTRVDPRGRASRPRSESAQRAHERAHTRTVSLHHRRARVDPTQREH